MTTHDIAWFAEQIGKTPDWVSRNRDVIPHKEIGRSIRFTEADLAEYLESVAVRPRMQTTGRKKST